MARHSFLFFALFNFLSHMFLHSQDSLVAYWSFDQFDGNTFFDESGNGYHGKNYGAEVISGIKGNALSFDGNFSYARIPGNGLSPPDEFAHLDKGSISLWFKVNHIPVDYGIAPIFYYGADEMCSFFDASNQGLIIEIGHSPIHMGSERLYFTIWKNGCTFPSFCYDSADPIQTGEWYHIVVVVGDNYNTGYLNGTEMVNRHYNFGDPTYSQFFSDAVVHEKLWLGKGYWDETIQHFDGAIDEVRIFDKDLNAAEIEELYLDTTISAVDPSSAIQPQLKIFPNPAVDKLHVQLSSPNDLIHAVKLIDGRGKVVLKSSPVGKQAILSVDDIPEGFYILEVYNHDQLLGREKVTIID